jgi:hypothetical protein
MSHARSHRVQLLALRSERIAWGVVLYYHDMRGWIGIDTS